MSLRPSSSPPPSPSPPLLPLMPDASSRIDSFNAKTTSVSYPWPKGVSGIERIALAAQGDLQRVLSAFLDRPIVVALEYSQTSRQSSSSSCPSLSPPEIISQPTPFLIASASPTSPITQTRQVHLKCAGKIVCTATSTVRITSPQVAHLFLQEKYAIGQMFRQMEKVPAFELINVGLGNVVDGERSRKVATPNPGKQLWRKYTLSIPHFQCEILEVFPDRQMFVDGERWLSGSAIMPASPTPRNGPVPELLYKTGNADTAVYQAIRPVIVGVLLLMGSFEIWRLFGGRAMC